MSNISPRALDWILNGVPVYIRRAPIDGKAYATTYDFSKFVREAPLEIMRLPIEKDTLATWKPEADPRVIKKLAEYNRS